MIAIDLSREQPLDDDPKAIQSISFSRILERDGNTIMLFNIKEVKETILDFSHR